ncbi:Hypothetical predicted protein [Mytilus galloprovincialis]|uniref:Uncharacterized protein n=1 Tax=Mytilus galloprovincialis TaxID=29158 RepID=A0A8B6BM99_MYTGA|nr:Hypothetical predicted protein [Mytilus galloprovincialis]
MTQYLSSTRSATLHQFIKNSKWNLNMQEVKTPTAIWTHNTFSGRYDASL